MSLQSYTGSLQTRPFDFSKHSQPTSKSLEFLPWLKKVTPSFTWTWPYLRHIREHLDRITDGECKRLMLFVPPRHGKTEMVTVRYPVWRIEHNPTLRVIVGAYNQLLANKFSRKARRIAAQRFELAQDRQAVEDWETPAGGGFRAVGVGAGVTGQGGQLVVIDDPVKNRAEAESEAYREAVWDWYKDDLYTRLEPGAAVILIQTRWHEDDLAGRILGSEDAKSWTVVSLPAEAGDNDPLGRKPGDALCPERYDKQALAGIHTVLGSRSYAALYQQSPQPVEGALAQREWFKIVGSSPVEARRVRMWDVAGTQKSAASDDPDWLVGTRLAYPEDKSIYIEDVVRARPGPGGVERLIKQTAELDGRRVPIRIELEGGGQSPLWIASMIKTLGGFDVREHVVSGKGDKVTRAMPFFAYAEAGNVKLVRAEWNPSWLAEISSFPGGVHDDRVDSASGGFNDLTAHQGWSRGPSA